jgi:metal-responsive CopG/Arc/MetJ family transcriptional regulator
MASRIINMTIPAELLKEADALARAEGRKRSELMREALRRYIDERHTGSKSSSALLSRLARQAVKGPNLPASAIDEVIYRAGRKP